MKLATSCENHRGITKQRHDFEQTTVQCRCYTDCGYGKEKMTYQCATFGS